VLGEEEVVGFDLVRVADDDQADQVVLVDPVPEHVTDVDQSLLGPATHIDGDLLPVPFPGLGGQLGWGGQPVPLRPGPPASPGAGWRGLVEGGVAGIREVRWVRGSPAPARVA